MNIMQRTPMIRRATLCFAMATFLLSFAGDLQSAPAQSAAADSQSTFTISGTVINELTGSPLDRTRVTLIDTNNQATRWSVITTENGHFAFTELPHGKFSLFAARRGFLRALYQQHERFSTAIVTGPALDSENLLMKLAPLATLSGKVLDETGEGVRGANVALFVENRAAGLKRIMSFNSDVTDDQGYYEFAALAPGDYFVSVTAKPWYAVHGFSSLPAGNNSQRRVPSALEVAYPTTYYNGATDSQSATAINAHAGDHSQVDIHLNPVPVLHLIVRVPQDPQRGAAPPAFEKRVFDNVEFFGADGMQQISPGVFELTGVPAGRYAVHMQDPGTGQMQEATEMNLTRDGQEIDGSQSQPAASVKFTVQMPLQAQLPKELYVGMEDSHGQVLGFQPVEPSGHVALENARAGKYNILAFSNDKRYSVTRAVSAGVEISPGEFMVTSGSSQEVTIYVTAGVVSVEGFVKHGNKAASGVMVALIPKNPQAHRDMFRRDQSDSDGSFVVRGVIPGAYTLVAVEDAWGFAWNQPEVLNRYIQHGQNLTVGPLMTQTVHLPEPVEVQPR
ncbi:MAG: carboxypeptidase-like regulatory domain-containing protein [Candidatus Acidiferrum sp.]